MTVKNKNGYLRFKIDRIVKFVGTKFYDMKKYLLLFSLLLGILLLKAQFSLPQDVSQSLRPYLISVADLNNDLQKDIIVAQEGNLIWMENQGGTYVNHVIVPDSFRLTSRSIAVIETGDFDNNGFIDIVYSDDNASSPYTAYFTILYNQNGSSFTPVVIDNMDHEYISVGDLDGDGDLDITASDFNENYIYINNGVGNFTVTSFEFGSQYRTGIQEIVDLDGDQFLDLVVYERYPYTNGYEGAIVYLDVAINQSGYQIGDIGNFNNMVVTDINNDTKDDIVITMGNSVLSYINIDSLTWEPVDTLHTVTNGSIENVGIGVEDFRNDLIKEIVYLNNRKLHKLVFNGSDYDDDVIDTVLNYSDLSLNFFDMNSDGFVDIIGAGGSVINSDNKNHISILESMPNHEFNRNIIYDADADAPKYVYSVDMDADGDKDLVVTLVDKQIYYENLGNNNFSNTQNLLFKGNYNSVYTEDFNNDNLPDFLVCHAYYDSAGVFLYENIGNNTFMKTNIAVPDSGVGYSTYIVDYDMDGDNDICLLSGYNFYMIPNIGGGNFGNKVLIFNKTASYRDVKFADFNGNGFPDLIIGYFYSFYRDFSYVPNVGGVFGSDILITDSLYSNSGEFKINAIEDYDFDGDLDLFASDAARVVWIKNEPGYPLDVVKTLTNIKVKSALDIDVDGDLDYIYKSPALNNYTLAYNEDGVYSDIQLFENEISLNAVHSNGSVYFGDFGNNLKDMVFYGASYGSSGSYDEVIFFKNKSDQIKKASGYMFYDQNQNKIFDSNELAMLMFNTIIAPQNAYSFSNNNGYYSYLLDSGQYQLSLINDPLWNLTSDSSSFNLDFETNLFYDNLNFGLYPSSIITDINPTLTGGFPRCDQVINYWVNVRNEGTTLPSGVIHLQLDDSVVYVASDLVPDSIIGQNLYWSYDSLFFHSEELINLQVLMPPFTSMGDTLESILTVTDLDSQGLVLYENSDTLSQMSVCAYDPNDKIVFPKGAGSEGYIKANQELEYLIRFQNTGNDTAITVVVIDSLDTNLDWETLVPLASSHSMEVSINQNGEAVFEFENIMLPDSNVNEVASHGFLKFRINQKMDLQPNTKMFNTGYIYFDSNPAVITNSVLNTVDSLSVITAVGENIIESNELTIIPNPFSGSTTFDYKNIINEEYSIVIYDINGREVIVSNDLILNRTTLDLSELTEGVYIAIGVTKSGKRMFTERIVAQ